MPLGKRTDCGDARFCGAEVPFAADVEAALRAAEAAGFDFIVAPLAAPGRRPPHARPAADGSLAPPFAPGEVMHTLASAALGNQVVGAVSGWVDPDAADAALAAASAAALRQELAWAAHLSCQAVALPAPRPGAPPASYAAALAGFIERDHSALALWVRVPAAAGGAAGGGGAAAMEADGGGPGQGGAEDPWEAWHALRALCDHSARLGALLELGADLPPPAALARWWGEPLRAVALAPDAWVANAGGHPVLPRAHQAYVGEALRRGVQVVLAGGGAGGAPAGAAAPTPAEQRRLQPAAGGGGPAPPPPLRGRWEYLSHLFRRAPAASAQEEAEAGYRDYLQAPLQPLADDLESATYETFERDAAKYDAYEEAARRFFADRAGAFTPAAPAVAVVAGAGRGPLVRRVLAAAAATATPLRLYAVEKNACACVHLAAAAGAEGWAARGVAPVVHADMRDWAGPPPPGAHLLVSELLGSFGDNELSPECLDGAARWLRPGGVSIPARYTSFLAPVAAARAWADVRAFDDLAHFETPFVVKMHRAARLAPAAPVFTFTHPGDAEHDARHAAGAAPRPAAPDPGRHERAAAVAFRTAPDAGGAALHGFAGYFEAALYGGVALSTRPETHTPSMGSWFPLFFPLRRPVRVPPGGEVRAHVWRRAARTKVWYEWALSAPEPGPVHNPGGRSYSVGL